MHSDHYSPRLEPSASYDQKGKETLKKIIAHTYNFKMCKGLGLAGVAQLVGHCPIKTQKGHRFDPGSGFMLSLWVWSLVALCTRGN